MNSSVNLPHKVTVLIYSSRYRRILFRRISDVSIAELPEFEETQIVDEIVVQVSGKYCSVDCEVAWQLQLSSLSKEVTVTESESKLDNAVF